MIIDNEAFRFSSAVSPSILTYMHFTSVKMTYSGRTQCFLSDHFWSHFLNAEHPPEESLVVLDVLGDGRVWVGWTRPGALQLVVLERAGQTLQSPSLTEINVHGRGEAHILLIIL